MRDLDAIFAPRSIAVLGASTQKGKVGYDILSNIIESRFTGDIYPVNPKADEILGKKTYKSILDVPADEVDLAIVILSPKLALAAVSEAIEKNIKGMVIVSAGFREVGAEGREIEDQIVAKCRAAGVRLVGPNCLGVINPDDRIRLNASFSVRMPSAGNISFISQSGALCTSVLDFAADRDFGFSKFISIGNKADVEELDLLRYLHEDPETDVIMMYLEELRAGREFIDEVKKITSGGRPTPILAIKSGRTSAGAQAAASHTGALAGSDAVYDAIFKQSGIIRCNTIDELFDFASAFSFKKSTPLGKLVRKIPSGNRVAIVTNAGGPGIIATDMTLNTGLELAKFSKETVAQLAETLPPTANIHNPVDVIGDASFDRYQNALSAVIRDDNVDGALVILTPQSMTNALETAKAIVDIAQPVRKPILCCFMGVVDVSPGVKYLQEHGYPVYKFPENAANAFAALYKFSSWVNREHMPQLVMEHDKQKAAGIIKDSLAAGKTYLGEVEGNALLECYGFPVLKTYLAKSEDEAVKAANEIGMPVVMKIVSPQIIHKSDAGGVMVNLKTEDKVRAAYRQIVENAKNYDAKAEITGVMVVKHAPKGEEIILGANRYPVFGPLLMFGLGGIFVEVFKDVEFRLAPINVNESHRMINAIKGAKILKGYRGNPPADMEVLKRLMVCLSDLMVNHPEISEIDINPLLAHAEGKGATVADCRIILATQR